MSLLLKTTTTTNTLFSSLFIHHSNQTTSHSFLFSLQLPKHNKSFHLKLPSSSSKTPTPATFDFQEDDEFDDDEEEEEEDDEDVYVPLSNMRQWTRNKPRGFGEGKVYDTTLEDKLLQELEQSRAAQLVNINNLKNNPNPNPLPQTKEVVPSGIRVRLFNLPKKKNIHRDLQAAFKPFTGITHIIPAVSGNQKTRDPVCKGFAFLHFKSHKEANRFVDIVSTQPITFGKVQKQIRCEIMPSVVDRKESPLPVFSATMAPPVTQTPLDPCLEVEEAAFDKLKIGDDDLVSATDDDNDNSFGNVVEKKHEAEVSSESLKKQKVVTEKGKKTTRAKKKVETTPKLSIPGSANRLKMKEKALLSGVFSKYGGKSSD
ncbi:putative nucleotide-binding alpha-beta plait domain superfamily, RNA-binding domain superfamily [Helianthus annuus]|nr:putative nucleotide-binding alpha-beta plait domain superfamily, RNA-binding domain superfamily [Helianthus annuus]KAJ0717569.1 putative nucleotide-binding alpha-beta plait domain superfamily, RNA-binding domain superfamily [Helianthus annuus]KAJ0899843.1 putative nucleotide-binding alpha-beta plait domain superfamily, RNA-binding domain superfamily [Helianthus annuus]